MKVIYTNKPEQSHVCILKPTTSLVTWWRHQMETFSALLAICAGNSPVPGEFPAQRPVTRSFDVFFHLRLNKRSSKQSQGWLRRYRAHNDVTVTTYYIWFGKVYLTVIYTVHFYVLRLYFKYVTSLHSNGVIAFRLIKRFLTMSKCPMIQLTWTTRFGSLTSQPDKDFKAMPLVLLAYLSEGCAPCWI